MTLYKQKTPTVNANQFDPASTSAEFAPLVGLEWLEFRSLLPDDIDPECGRAWSEHAWVGSETDGRLTCPNDYIITSNDGEVYSQPRAEFEARWETA